VATSSIQEHVEEFMNVLRFAAEHVEREAAA
jgi:hypothetical protein